MGIWWLCWTVVPHTSVGLISLTHASMDSDNHTTTLCLLCSQEPPKSYHVLRTLRCPSESIRLMDVRFCFVVLAQLPNPLRVLSKTQPQRLKDDGYTCGRLKGGWPEGISGWRKGNESAMFFLVKNTPSVMAAKINKNHVKIFYYACYSRCSQPC